MASILQELYYGNITPNARGVKRGSAYNKAGSKMTEAQDKLHEVLDKPQAELLKTFSDAYSELLSLDSMEMWVLGFKMGIRIGMEVMELKTDNFSLY